VFLESDDIVLQ